VNLIAVTVYGPDRRGIIYGISNVLAENNINIVDIEQNVIHGLFVMFIVADISKSKISLRELEKRLKDVGKSLGVEVHVSKFEKPKSKGEKPLRHNGFGQG